MRLRNHTRRPDPETRAPLTPPPALLAARGADPRSRLERHRWARRPTGAPTGVGTLRQPAARGRRAR